SHCPELERDWGRPETQVPLCLTRGAGAGKDDVGAWGRVDVQGDLHNEDLVSRVLSENRAVVVIDTDAVANEVEMHELLRAERLCRRREYVRCAVERNRHDATAVRRDIEHGRKYIGAVDRVLHEYTVQHGGAGWIVDGIESNPSH